MGLALCAGLLAVGLSTPAWARVTGSYSDAVSVSATAMTQSLGQQVDSNLAAARSTLLAQGMMPQPMMTYVAILSPQAVVPNAPRSDARGAVGAVLVGNRLVVRASFRDLTSGPRNYETDPVDPPNPNITSAFHIHRGSPMENGPFQYALEVMLNDTGMGGDARGEFTLTPEQVQALNDGMLYVDLHTTRHRGGELRGVLMAG
ncbi:CHRD domain-containing protein [Leptolyngbya sp. BL0902]|nr:CHRD domain-containing protein [Leptolyngbya sp. BL0902]